jgi:hypothetical protein
MAAAEAPTIATTTSGMRNPVGDFPPEPADSSSAFLPAAGLRQTRNTASNPAWSRKEETAMKIGDRIQAAAITTFIIVLTGCDVEQTREGDVTLPAYEVSKTRDGNLTLPEYEVTTPEVTVETKEIEVEVPTVTTEKKTVTVPDVDVKTAD